MKTADKENPNRGEYGQHEHCAGGQKSILLNQVGAKQGNGQQLAPRVFRTSTCIELTDLAGALASVRMHLKLSVG